jgi:hypothetical protein
MKMHNKLHVFWMLLILMVPMLLMLSVANAQPPTNDVNAEFISALPFIDTINTSEATVSPDDPSTCYVPFNTVWYAGTPGVNKMIEANTFGSDYDTTLTVVAGSPNSFSQIACNDDSGISSSRVQSKVTFNGVAGEQYYFMVGSKRAGGGNLVFNVKEGIDVTTTTTTIKPSLCAAEAVYGENSEQTELLKEYRDHVLRNTTEGQEIIESYYKFSPTVTKLLEQRPLLKNRAKAFIDSMLPEIRKKVEENNKQP